MSQYRAWCFTLNNPDEDEVLVPQTWDPKDYSYLVYQLEEGEQGTRHLQGYIYCKKITLNGIAKWFPRRPHLETAKGTAKQNRKYCTKEKGRVDGPWEFGVMPEQGKRTDLLAVKEDLDNGASLREIARDHFANYVRYSKGIKEYKQLNAIHTDAPKTVICYWGPTGVGKTRRVFEEHPDAYWKTRDPGTSQYWDAYDGEDTIVIDEFYGWLPWDFVLRLTDRYPLKLAVKGSTVPSSATKIIFTSNKHPRDWYPNSRYQWDALNPLRRRFTDIVECTRPDEPMGGDCLDPVPTGSVPTFRNGLPLMVDLSEEQV